MSHIRAAATAAGLTAVLCASTMLAITPARASGGSGVRSGGTCSGGGVWKLKAKHDNGRIEVEFEVDTNRVGQRWHVRITDNSHLVKDRYATTVAPSGSFTVRTVSGNRVGTDTIRASATRGTRTCSGLVRL
jgi:hypothetical protein